MAAPRCLRSGASHEGTSAVTLRTPYLLFIGDAPDQLAAKTADGIAFWRPEICLGQLRLPGCKADRKSTRLNSSHSQISYAVLCLKKKNVHSFATILLQHL